MIHISPKEVMRIAQVSTIALSESEIPEISKKLQEVLNYAHCVAQVAQETSGITDEMIQLHNVFRQDSSISFDAQMLFKRAPHIEGEFFVVPLILDSAE